MAWYLLHTKGKWGSEAPLRTTIHGRGSWHEGKLATSTSTTRTWIRSAAWLAILFAVIGIAIFGGRNAGKRRALAHPSTGSKGLGAPSAAASVSDPQSATEMAARPVFPYSVIPGGVESAEELRNALVRDPVVADHYQGFDVARARVVRLDQDRAVFVSYRIGDRIYWTKNRLMLHQGEALITDGTLAARTRCGNRVSDLAMVPVSPAQPSEEAMEALAAPEFLAAPLPFELPIAISPISPPVSVESPSGSPAGGIVLPFFPIVGGGTPTPSTPGSPSGPPVGPPAPPTGPLPPPIFPPVPPTVPVP